MISHIRLICTQRLEIFFIHLTMECLARFSKKKKKNRTVGRKDDPREWSETIVRRDLVAAVVAESRVFDFLGDVARFLGEQDVSAVRCSFDPS